MEIWSLGTAALGTLVLLLVGLYAWRRMRGRELAPPSGSAEVVPLPARPAEADFPVPSEVSVETASSEALSRRLDRTRGALFGGLAQFFSSGKAAPDSEEWEKIEEVLLGADVGVRTAAHLVEQVKLRSAAVASPDLKALFQRESEKIFEAVTSPGWSERSALKPWVISIVGVNGAGKTTTIGKLAEYFRGQDKSVLLGAGDTFRAAAISQLKIWAERTRSQFVAGREGGDPGAVAFDAVTAAKARGLDVVLLDTAGRLHTKSNLMEELRKVHRVVKKVIDTAPHDTWLVIDGTLGQNSVQQAREFQKTLELTGIVVTKLDGTAKGGAILSIAAELNLPIFFIGVGEAAGDLLPFDAKAFVQAIFGD